MAKKGFWRFFSEVKNEAKKISWPTRKQLISSTGAVIVVLIVAGAFLALMDLLYTNVITELLKNIIGA
ncbi:MAG: preprotein translocase subunit SecE [Kosmotoga sp.]|nr:MAG: preprotein translocase subunit SecE [Kosmotoga sp.]